MGLLVQNNTSGDSADATQRAATTFDIEYLTGQFEPDSHPDFIEIDSIYADRPGMYMRQDAYMAFLKMFRAALLDSVVLQIRSAARNFEYQKGIWERKWSGETKIENGTDASVAYPVPKDRALAILRYSSMPGTSRHHWGTDIDLNAFENSWFETGDGLRLYNWMIKNASAFGYCQPYTEKSSERPTGYEEEKWHWSFLPVSQPLTTLAKQQLSNDNISGFMGSQTAAEIDVVNGYVLGINQQCVQ